MGSCAATKHSHDPVNSQAIRVRTLEDIRKEELQEAKAKQSMKVPKLEIEGSGLYIRRKSHEGGLLDQSMRSEDNQK